MRALASATTPGPCASLRLGTRKVARRCLADSRGRRAMQSGPKCTRGNVDAILNGLVRQGVITGFETNFDDPVSFALALHVKVTADVITDARIPGYDAVRVRAIRNRVAKEIAPLSPDVIVSVRPEKAPPQA